MLVHKYEMFKMQPYKSIGDMFTRFSEIINNLQSLGKSYSLSDLVRKILSSLTPDWEKKTTAIEETKDLSTYSLEDFIGNLTSYEVQMKEKEIENVPIKKSMAFKASLESDDSEDDIALIFHKFKDFLKERRIKRTKEKLRKESSPSNLG